MIQVSLAGSQLVQSVVEDAFNTAVREATKAACDNAAQLEGLAAAVNDIAAASALKPAEPKPKPQPTGIKPRMLLLPALVLVLMAIPVVGVFLPVFLKAGEQRDEETKKQISVGIVFPTPLDVLNVGRQMSTPRSPPLSAEQKARVQEYLAQSQANASVVRPRLHV